MDIVDKETYQHAVPILSNGSTEITLLKMLLEVGDTFVDVGANIGTLSVHGAKLVGRKGMVVAIEPQPRLAEALRMTKIHNKLDQLNIIEAAAGQRGGKVEFYPSPSSSGAASCRREALTENARYLVKMTSIDEVADELQIENIRLLKVDVEGAELSVFQGSHKTLSASAPYVSFEINPLVLAVAQSKAISFLQGLSYTKFYDVSSVVDGSLIEIGEVNELVNVLAVHSTRVSELHEKLGLFNLWVPSAALASSSS
jgi:FkbM family methyltransferase